MLRCNSAVFNISTFSRDSLFLLAIKVAVKITSFNILLENGEEKLRPARQVSRIEWQILMLNGRGEDLEFVHWYQFPGVKVHLYTLGEEAQYLHSWLAPSHSNILLISIQRWAGQVVRAAELTRKAQCLSPPHPSRHRHPQATLSTRMGEGSFCWEVLPCQLLPTRVEWRTLPWGFAPSPAPSFSKFRETYFEISPTVAQMNRQMEPACRSRSCEGKGELTRQWTISWFLW